jgi:hypothetical protein
MLAKKTFLTLFLIGSFVLLAVGGLLFGIWGMPVAKLPGASGFSAYPYPGIAYPAVDQYAGAYPFSESPSTTSYPSPTAVPLGVRIGPPTVRPSPTAANGAPPPRYNGLLVTPLPNEKIQVGPLTLWDGAGYPPLETPTAMPPYTVRGEWVGTGAKRHLFLFIRDSKTGAETQFGNPDGSAQFGTGNAQYIIWESGCNGCLVLPTGLYAYSLETGIETQIGSPTIGNGYPRLDGSWVIYASQEKDGPMQSVLDLHAHNLLTGEDIVVSRDVVNAFRAGSSSFVNDYYLLQGDRVGWITWSGIGIYDLARHTTRTLNAPKPKRAPRHWTISGDIMLWQDEFYQGYDLKRDAYFSIPIIPPGWEDKVILSVGPVRAEGDSLYWSLETGGQIYYFSAPLIAKEQGDTVSSPGIPTLVSRLISTPVPFLVSTSSP